MGERVIENPFLEYYSNFDSQEIEICEQLTTIIGSKLGFAEAKIWHAHPVWFIDGNPIVGYSKQKAGIKLMFWSGSDFDEPSLLPGSGKFRDASIIYETTSEINWKSVEIWLEKSKFIQWDYKNVVKRKGELVRLQIN
jgi:hypothetical protein